MRVPRVRLSKPSSYRIGDRTLLGRGARQRMTNLHQSWRAKRFKHQGGACALCGKPMLHSDDRRTSQLPHLAATLDHILPLSRGGEDHWENTQAVHHACNQKKGNTP